MSVLFNVLFSECSSTGNKQEALMTFWWAKESIGSDRGFISDLVIAGGMFWDRKLTEASFILSISTKVCALSGSEEYTKMHKSLARLLP